jgi:peptide chain release factor 2
MLQTQASKLSDTWQQFGQFQERYQETHELLGLAEEEGDQTLLTEVHSDACRLAKEVEEFFLKSMLNEEADSSHCFIELRAGSGGTESCDWVQILSRMYLRWAAQQNYQAKLIDYTDGEVAGYKNATIQVHGPFAFGWAKYESGVHRFVRISPFDSNGKRHTSFISVQVLPLSSEEDQVDIELDPRELKIEVMRAQGAGGQHVNTTESAVRITHIPTNTVVFCQNERSQHQNKATAMELMKAKLYTRKLQQKSQEKKELYSQLSENAWGSQIRSYVLQPYRMIKDSRTGFQTSNVDAVLDGDVQGFMQAALMHFKNKDS